MVQPSQLPYEAAAAALREGRYPAEGDWVLRRAVQLLCDSIARPPAALTGPEAAKAAQALNAHLDYELTLQLSAAWNYGDRFDLRVARQRAQALINRRRLDEAETCIADALERADGCARELSAESLGGEVARLRGLQARIPKDRYVREYERRGDPAFEPDEALEQALLAGAIARSRALYRPGTGAWWPGVNLIALLSRQARERGESFSAEATALATELLAEIRTNLKNHRQKREALDAAYITLRRGGAVTWTEWQKEDNRWRKADAELHWLLASASEASLVLPMCRESELWLYRFIADPRTAPFDLASYERQLREIWQAVEDEGSRYCPSRVLAILARHLRTTTRSVSLTTQEVRQLRGDNGDLEKNFSGESQFSVGTIREMLDICASIGRVSRPGGEFVGTGFLVDLKALAPQRESEIVFVTNAHVVSPDFGGAIRPQQAEITFELAPQGAPRYAVADVLFYSEPGRLGVALPQHTHLDICVVRLTPPPQGFAGLRIAEALPERGPRTKAYVIGHPRARPMQISLHDSALLDYDRLPRLIHYRTPTDPGSSGSPVFDENWKVIGVHHAGRTDAPRLDGQGFYEANEGIAIAALSACLARGQTGDPS